MKNLVVVESPTKARTISRFLGEDYSVIASMGHIYDLPKSKLGVDTEKDFAPAYELMKDKKKRNAKLRIILLEGIGKAKVVEITDADLEVALHDLC